MRKVLFVLDHLGTGGTQEFILNYCRQVAGQRITVASLFGNNLYGEELRQVGAEVVHLTERPYGYANVLRPEPFLALRRFLRARGGEFDSIQLRLFAAFFYGSLLQLYRSGKVGAGLDCGSRQLPGPLKTLYAVFARRYTQFWLHPELWAQFPYLRLEAARLRSQMYFVTDRSSQRPYPFPHRYNLLSVGRCIPQKGHAEAVDAFAAFCVESPDADAALYVIGDGPELPALRARVPEPLRERVFFTGAVRNFGDYLTACDGVVKMAQGESVNSVVREALWLGKPVASTLEADCCRQWMREHPGLLTPLTRGDHGQCAGAFRTLLAEAADPQGETARHQRRNAARALWSDEAVLARCTY